MTKQKNVLAYIGFGSNLGDRKVAISLMLQALKDNVGITLLRCSAIYETDPCGLPSGSPRFLNGVVEISTTLKPDALLQRLLCFERKAGRSEAEKGLNLPRVLDLDILLYGDVIIQQPKLQIPHPRILERWFVLKPLSDLIPEKVIPGTEVCVQSALNAVEPTSVG